MFPGASRMSDGEDLLDKADALIRRRIFVAGPIGEKTSSIETADATIDDVPILTQIVTEPVAPRSEILDPAPPDRIDALAREMLFDRLPVQRQSVADQVSAWLDAELPQIVMRVMDSVTDQMIAHVTAEVQSVLLPRLQAALESEDASKKERG